MSIGSSESYYFFTGVESIQNQRPHMEDTFLVCEDLKPLLPFTTQISPVSLFAVFDGHAGSFTSHYCKENLIQILVKNKKLLYSPEISLKKAILTLDRKILRISARQKLYSGSTAVIALLIGTKLIVGWVGDSRAIICQENRGKRVPISLTVDHRPTSNVKEAKRIKAAGGWITASGVNDLLGIFFFNLFNKYIIYYILYIFFLIVQFNMYN
eukprot:TRINITY_DN651_c1_g1_i2.p1 TRINITY_DN651_c1_g1~~TRINITY_DN651_c1_g1_i2.p1  ORF type:complete len:212 (+),score=64.62 TRINITY_DN651_c1_g1_i2:107-742(+)